MLTRQPQGEGQNPSPLNPKSRKGTKNMKYYNKEGKEISKTTFYKKVAELKKTDKATLKVTATKEEFQELYKMIEASELRDIRDSKIYDEVLRELLDLIQYMAVGEDTNSQVPEGH